MRPSRLGLCCLILCLLSPVAFAGGWTPGSFPNPITDLQKCGRQGPDGARKASWICDPDNILSEGAVPQDTAVCLSGCGLSLLHACLPLSFTSSGGANEVEGIMADVAKGTSPYVSDACMPSDAAVPGYMVRMHLYYLCRTMFPTQLTQQGTGASWIAQGCRCCVSREIRGWQRPAGHSWKC